MTVQTWSVAFYGSGTTIVHRALDQRPYYSIFGWPVPNVAEPEHGRYTLAHELCDWLNGGPAPAWLRGMVKRRSHSFEACDSEGRRISAIGPIIYSGDPGAGHWTESRAPDFVLECRYMRDCLVRGVRPGEAVPA